MQPPPSPSLSTMADLQQEHDHKELLRRHAAGDPEVQGEIAELHLRRMAEIVAEAESP